jgi:hypothetical protein
MRPDIAYTANLSLQHTGALKRLLLLRYLAGTRTYRITYRKYPTPGENFFYRQLTDHPHSLGLRSPYHHLAACTRPQDRGAAVSLHLITAPRVHSGPRPSPPPQRPSRFTIFHLQSGHNRNGCPHFLPHLSFPVTHCCSPPRSFSLAQHSIQTLHMQIQMIQSQHLDTCLHDGRGSCNMEIKEAINNCFILHRNRIHSFF